MDLNPARRFQKLRHGSLRHQLSTSSATHKAFAIYNTFAKYTSTHCRYKILATYYKSRIPYILFKTASLLLLLSYRQTSHT